MKVENYKRDNYLLTTDRKKTDIDSICGMLAKSYWANTRKREVTETALENSLCFNLYCEDKQIGIARMVTDYATFAYLCDVYIEEDYRGNGLGKWLIECILSHPGIKDLKRIDLATRDAHELYRKFGFAELLKPESRMERITANS
jgi:GNAT superfamily N-acetyltransferase